MGKQHYIETARIIRDRTKGATRRALCDDFAALFAADNPRFDRGRWELAVLGGEVIERPGCTPRPL